MKSPMAVSSLTATDEATLVAQAREGDATAFSELVRRYEGKIFRLAQHVTQNREDAEDVLQETFMKAYEHLDQFQGNSKFYTWIVRIAVNQALMKLRRRKTDKSVSLDEAIDTGEDTVVREIAAWDEDPEERYTREELGDDSGYGGAKPGPAVSLRLHASGCGRAFDRGDRRSARPVRAGREEPAVARALAASRETHPLLQTQGRGCLCLPVRISSRI